MTVVPTAIDFVICILTIVGESYGGSLVSSPSLMISQNNFELDIKVASSYSTQSRIFLIAPVPIVKLILKIIKIK